MGKSSERHTYNDYEEVGVQQENESITITLQALVSKTAFTRKSGNACGQVLCRRDTFPVQILDMAHKAYVGQVRPHQLTSKREA